MNRASLLILVGVFLNFFGFFIASFVAKQLGFFYFPEFYFTRSEQVVALVHLGMVFLVLLVIYLLLIGRHKRSGLGVKKVLIFRDLPNTKAIELIISFLFIGIATFKILNSSVGFELSARGLNQFDRDIGDLFARIELLIFPLVIYVLQIRSRKVATFAVLLLFLSYVVESFLTSDRRLLSYFIVILIFLMSRNVSKVFSRRAIGVTFLLLAFMALIVAVYLNRFLSIDGELAMFAVFRGLFTINGLSAIYPQVLYYIDYETGYLLGQPFLIYISTLMIPSAISSLLFGFDELNDRSAFLFDRLFNDNPNMGYDFMMIADFYWSFGFLGLLFFIVTSFFVIKFIIKHEKSNNDLYFGLSVIVSIYFIAGQRSDFGFFLKNVIYSSVFYYLIYSLSRLRFRVK